MEEIRQKHSPNSVGWYIGLKFNNEPFVFYYKNDGTYEINVPWEFSNNPNLKFYLDPNSWNVICDKQLWCRLKECKPLNDVISSNVELEMAYRESLVGSRIKFNDKMFKIAGLSHHIHCWAIYNIENIDTKETRQIQLQGYDEWSSGGGIDKIEVEILI